MRIICVNQNDLLSFEISYNLKGKTYFKNFAFFKSKISVIQVDQQYNEISICFDNGESIIIQYLSHDFCNRPLFYLYGYLLDILKFTTTDYQIKEFKCAP